jgi:hypothetical protein
VKTRSAVLPILVLAVALQSWQIPFASAQEADIPALRSRIVELEGRIAELEALIEASKAAQKSPEGDQTGWQNKKNWRKLSLGMPDREVRQLLGNPSKVIPGVKTLWYYPNLYCGYVTFDEKGQLVGWNEP